MIYRIRVEDLIKQMAADCGVPADKIKSLDINQLVETAIENQDEPHKASIPDDVIVENHKSSLATGKNSHTWAFLNRCKYSKLLYVNLPSSFYVCTALASESPISVA